MLISAAANHHVTVHSNNHHHHLQVGTQCALVHYTTPIQAHGPLGLRTVLDALIYKAAD